VVGLVFGLLWGCNPFATRTPEPPEGAQIDYLPRNLAENILENLRMSCEHRRAADYMSWLTEDFQFEPDPGDAVTYEDEFSEPWDGSREETFVSRWLDKNNTLSIQFSRWERTFQETVGEEERLEYAYALELQHLRDAPKHVEGKGYFSLKADEQGRWAIFHWIDERTNVSMSSWGELRARF
jgi:hypothetical protein